MFHRQIGSWEVLQWSSSFRYLQERFFSGRMILPLTYRRYGASIKLFIAVLSAWRAKAIFFLRFSRDKILPLEDHKKITSFHRRTKPWNILIHSDLWLIASGAQSLSTVWKSTYEESCTTAYSGCCSSFSWLGFLMEWSYTGCFSAINHRSRRFYHDTRHKNRHQCH